MKSCLLTIGLTLAALLGLPTAGQAGLIVEYSFEGNALDSSGNAQHGALFGGAGYTAGYDGSGLSLNGSNAYMWVDLDTFSFSTFTVEAWINVPTYGSNIHYVSLYENAYIVLGRWSSAVVDTWVGGLTPVNAAGSFSQPSGLATNTWQHIALTYDGSYQRLYINGAEVGTGALSTGTPISGGSLTEGLVIGARYTQQTQYVEGVIDEVRIWDEALDPAQLGFYGGACSDQDADGYGVGDTTACSNFEEDCDDADPLVNPGATEVCNGVDDDCDGSLPADEEDVDGDGYRTCEGDCDDGSLVDYPGAVELCDGLDNDCDGSLPADEQDVDGDGYRTCEGDCDDGSSVDYPGAVELCDGLDNDCDGSLPTEELDGDGDGAWPCNGDCDDDNPAARPFGFEDDASSCADGTDNDCDGLVDLDDPDCAPFLGDDDDASGDDDDASGDDDDASGDDDDASGDDDDAGDDEEEEDRSRDRGSLCGCSTGLAEGPGGLLALVAMLALLPRRRRSSPCDRVGPTSGAVGATQIV